MLIVHPWIVESRGGERTFYEIARAFPRADLALLFLRSARAPADIVQRVAQLSFLSSPVFDRIPYRLLAPLLPWAAESIKTEKYDVILSSSSGWSHGVRTNGHPHLCYMYTPPRYLWLSDRLPARFPTAAGAGLKLLRPFLRRWDRAAARRVSRFAAISRAIRDRINNIYARDAEIIYPPVDVARMHVGPDDGRDFALTVAELVPYKRVDAAVVAARNARVPLVIVGDGPERPRLARLADGADVRLVGRISEERLVDLMSRARLFLFPAVEDFGIATVEALASGTPVVGVDAGGTAEIVPPGMGELVSGPDGEMLAEAVAKVWHRSFDRAALRRHAESFGLERFRTQVQAWVADGHAIEPVHVSDR